MQFVVRYFPEIILKSRPVRKQMSRQLQGNLQSLLRGLDVGRIRVVAGWDKLVVHVEAPTAETEARVVAVLRNTPGIAHFMDVEQCPLTGLPQLAERVLAIWRDRLDGRTFAVRCRRRGTHAFSSRDVECAVGAALLRGSGARGVDLARPDCVVRVEVVEDRVSLVNRRWEGLGGYPSGSIGGVLSLVSGGFDSTVASFQAMRRGLLTHFLFFNLGGHAHEVGVREVAAYLWTKYGASRPVRFVSVPFDEVVAEILQCVDERLMGVVLKRMMLRAAEKIAADMGVCALVTGDSVAQVSSQTLHNLSVVDQACGMLVLRPLISCDKSSIVEISRAIGAEDFAASMPEYCGVISVKPATRARLDRVQASEAKLDAALLERAVARASSARIDQLALDDQSAPDLEVMVAPVAGSIILDVRHPDDVERAPLQVPGIEVQAIPFFELHRRFAALDQARRYMLYCDQGVMSRIHAAHLVSEGHANVCVYRPMLRPPARSGAA